MKFKIVKATDQAIFESELNAAILQLQKGGNSEFQIHYQPLFAPPGQATVMGQLMASIAYVIYTALISYK